MARDQSEVEYGLSVILRESVSDDLGTLVSVVDLGSGDLAALYKDVDDFRALQRAVAKTENAYGGAVVVYGRPK